MVHTDPMAGSGDPMDGSGGTQDGGTILGFVVLRMVVPPSMVMLRMVVPLMV